MKPSVHQPIAIAKARALPSSSSPISRFAQKVRRWETPYRNRVYRVYERLLAALSQGRTLRILIADSRDWKGFIEDGFHGSRHKVEFGPITHRSFEEYDLVVPLSISDLIQARQWPQLVLKNPIPFPSEESVSLCDDKYQFNQRLIDTGFGLYVPKMGTGLKRPYILKKRIGIWGRECHVIHDLAEETDVGEQLNDPAYFCQEFIRGRREFATHILFVKDRIVKSLNIMYEFESETPIKGQDNVLYQIIHRCPYLGLFSDILRSIGFQGLCCVNYKVARGRPYILEINPRFGGSLGPYFFSFVRHLNPHALAPTSD